MILDKIHPFYFFLALAVGLMYCYVTNPKPELVVKFPSPFNAGKVTYHDKSNACYKYKSDKITCPTDKSLIKDQPIMEDYVNIK